MKYWSIFLMIYCLSSGLSSTIFAQETVIIDPIADAVLRYDVNNYGAQYTNYGSYTQFSAYCNYGATERSVIKFDLSEIPAGAIIQNAELFLYNRPNSPHTVGNNQSKLYQVTQNWTESSVVFYYFQYTSTGAITVPAATSSTQDYTIDVTTMVNNWHNGTYTNNGLLLKLDTELSGRSLIFASREYSDASKHPKLVVTYTIDRSNKYKEGFEIGSKWSNIDGDSNDWTRDKDGTPSIGTGPSNATEGIYYNFIETSYYTTKKVAYLLSPEYDLSDKDNAILEFDYHMYGATIGSLLLSISTNGGVSWGTIWAKYGNQGNQWNKQLLNLGSYIGYENVLLRFTGNTGSSYTGDIAIDNIRLSTNTLATPSTDENYIYSATALSENGLEGPMLQSVQYFDGLGRLNQEVQVSASPNGNDLVRPIVYDEFGRIERNYLAFPSESINAINGGFRDYDVPGDDVLGEQETFYQDHFGLSTNNPYAYSFTVYDNSPLNRVLEQGAPGASWQPDEELSTSGDYVQKFEYGTNVTGDDVRLFTVNTTTGNIENSTPHYAVNELYKNTFYDEEDHLTEEFKDKQGQVVLKRSFDDHDQNSQTPDIVYSTYYVYDDFGLLRFVIPPKTLGDNGIPSQAALDGLCYQYKYDERKRMIEKKLPGADIVSMVYDDRDRLVGIQDGKQEDIFSWTMTKYDALNRPIIMAKKAMISQDREDIQAQINSFYANPGNEYFEERTSSGYGYSDQSYPNLSYYANIMSITYYDNYDFLSLDGFAGLNFNAIKNIDDYNDLDGNTNGYFDRVTGLATGSKTYMTSGSYPVYSAIYYDNKYRPIQSQSSLYQTGTSLVSTKFDFAGNILESIEIQSVDGIESSLRTKYEYDHMGRPLETYLYFKNPVVNSLLQNAPVLLSQNVYNELGELQEKNLHSKDNSKFLQSIDYKYNIRGWLTEINNPDDFSQDNDYFGMRLFYEAPSQGMGATAQYNGNISAVEWQYYGGSGTKGYAYKYDELNRIKSASSQVKSGSYWDALGDYEVYDIDYDLNGNIEKLKRVSLDVDPEYPDESSIIDNLTYNYSLTGNKLNYVSDASYNPMGFEDGNTTGNDYDYDANGNMTEDLNKKINISYNFLNLPENVSSTLSSTDKIDFFYDATGVKWQKQAKVAGVTTTTTYNGRFIYTGSEGNRVLDYVITPEGIIKNLSTPEYQYFLKDHLGNTRATIVDLNDNGILDPSTEVLQTADYYPFGMQHYSQGGDNKYLYNGKELQDDVIDGVNLDWYDYGARMYDPALGRWHVPDLLGFLYESYSPYNYVLNSPMNYIDPFGLDVWTTSDPAAIRAFMNQVKSYGTANPQGEGWDHTSDEDFLQGLNYNDESGNFNFTKGMIINGEASIKCFIFPNIKAFSGFDAENPGTLSMPNGLQRAELWMSNPSENLSQKISKSIANLGYGMINSPYKMLFNKTISGYGINSAERMDAFVDTAPSVVLMAVKSASIVKLNSKPNPYNSFLHNEKRISNADASKFYNVNNSNLSTSSEAGLTQDVVNKVSNFIKSLSDEN